MEAVQECTTENETKGMEQNREEKVISYRLKCTESGNGLSHYIMYGDIPEEL